jgi:hypothetical protein
LKDICLVRSSIDVGKGLLISQVIYFDCEVLLVSSFRHDVDVVVLYGGFEPFLDSEKSLEIYPNQCIEIEKSV